MWYYTFGDVLRQAYSRKQFHSCLQHRSHKQHNLTLISQSSTLLRSPNTNCHITFHSYSMLQGAGEDEDEGEDEEEEGEEEEELEHEGDDESDDAIQSDTSFLILLILTRRDMRASSSNINGQNKTVV